MMKSEKENKEAEEQVEQAARAVAAPLVLNVRYHHAHTGYYQQPSVIEINQEERTIKINETPFFLGDNILVKFSAQGIKTILNEEITISEKDRHKYAIDRVKNGKIKTNDNLNLEVDTYSGAVVVKYKSLSVYRDPYSYNEKIGYYELDKKGEHRDYKPTDDFGYILESPPRMMMILLKGLAFVENLQKGIMKFRTSSFDVNGYAVQLFPVAILEITQLADRIKNNILESDPPLKEVREEKDENFELVSNAGVEASADLLGADVAE